MIQVKNLSNSMFDEAYFVLRENASPFGRSEGDMVKEAGKIIEENQITLRRRPKLWQYAIGFFSGAAAAGSLALLLWWMF